MLLISYYYVFNHRIADTCNKNHMFPAVLVGCEFISLDLHVNKYIPLCLLSYYCLFCQVHYQCLILELFVFITLPYFTVQYRLKSLDATCTSPRSSPFRDLRACSPKE